MSFSLWEKGTCNFKVKKKLSRLKVKERWFWHHFTIVSVKLSISLLLKEAKFKVYYDVVIF